MTKLKVVRVIRSLEDSRKPFALVFQTAFGQVAQPCTTEVLLLALNQIFKDYEVSIDVEIV